MEDERPVTETTAPAREGWLPPYRGLGFWLSLKWLVAGALLYGLLLLVAIKAAPDELITPFLGPSVYLTPVFGLPYVLRTINRPGRMRRIVYFLLMLPPIHLAAVYIAFYQFSSAFDPINTTRTFASALMSGGWGGLVGAVFGFTGLYLARLMPRRRVELVTIGFFTAVLTVLGAVGMGQAVLFAGTDYATAARDSEALIIGFESVHLPWQAAFAVALAWLMRPRHAPKRAPNPSPPPES